MSARPPLLLWLLVGVSTAFTAPFVVAFCLALADGCCMMRADPLTTSAAQLVLPGRPILGLFAAGQLTAALAAVGLAWGALPLLGWVLLRTLRR